MSNIEFHVFNKRLKGMPYLICSKCGMVKLNNPFSVWCAKMGCDHEEHPDYNNQRNKAAHVS